MGERWYRSALCWPHFWTIWIAQALHTPITPGKLVLGLPPDTPAMVGTAPAAIQASTQAPWSPVSAGSQPQRSQHDGEARTEMTESQHSAPHMWVSVSESTGIALTLTDCYFRDVVGTPRGFSDMFPIP